MRRAGRCQSPSHGASKARRGVEAARGWRRRFDAGGTGVCTRGQERLEGVVAAPGRARCCRACYSAQEAKASSPHHEGRAEGRAASVDPFRRRGDAMHAMSTSSVTLATQDFGSSYTRVTHESYHLINLSAIQVGFSPSTCLETYLSWCQARAYLVRHTSASFSPTSAPTVRRDATCSRAPSPQRPIPITAAPPTRARCAPPSSSLRSRPR